MIAAANATKEGSKRGTERERERVGSTVWVGQNGSRGVLLK